MRRPLLSRHGWGQTAASRRRPALASACQGRPPARSTRTAGTVAHAWAGHTHAVCSTRGWMPGAINMCLLRVQRQQPYHLMRPRRLGHKGCAACRRAPVTAHQPAACAAHEPAPRSTQHGSNWLRHIRLLAAHAGKDGVCTFWRTDLGEAVLCAATCTGGAAGCCCRRCASACWMAPCVPACDATPAAGAAGGAGLCLLFALLPAGLALLSVVCAAAAGCCMTSRPSAALS
jgi:hypothetical protein